MKLVKLAMEELILIAYLAIMMANYIFVWTEVASKSAQKLIMNNIMDAQEQLKKFVSRLIFAPVMESILSLKISCA